MRRAAASIPLNIAEGAAQIKLAEKARFYRMARRSAWECLAILDVLKALGVRHPGLDPAEATIVRVSGMLSRLLENLEIRAGREPPASPTSPSSPPSP